MTASKSAKPFVIVLDIYMPQIGGYDALLLLKQNQNPKSAWWKTVPVILNSSMPSEEIIEKSYQAGAHAFLTKTHDLGPLKNLIETLRSSLQYHQARPALTEVIDLK